MLKASECLAALAGVALAAVIWSTPSENSSAGAAAEPANLFAFRGQAAPPARVSSDPGQQTGGITVTPTKVAR